MTSNGEEVINLSTSKQASVVLPVGDISITLLAKDNYGVSAVPKWNFHKILINKSGKIETTYSSFTKPTSKKIINKIEELIN